MKSVLHLQTGIRDGITFLKESFFTQPFKLANITEDKKSNLLQLMLMSSSPGILNGDAYELKIDISPESFLQLQTQSYQRLYNMKESATQTMKVCVAKGGAFCYLPHPTVPHEHSSFSATNEIYLEKNCTLLWGEVITCGRKGSGELFLFSKFHNITKIFIENKLVMKENILLEPSLVNPIQIGQLEGYTHQATMIFLNEFADVKKLKEAIVEFLAEKTTIEFGVTNAPVNGIILRLLGNKAEQLFDLLQTVAKNIIDLKNIPHVG